MVHRSILRFCLIAAFLALTSGPAAAESPSGAAPPLPPDVPADADLRSIITSGTKAGDEAVWRSADGSVQILEQYNDRGRGPVLHTVERLGADGLASDTHIFGLDYFKNPVDEHFSSDAKHATWKSAAENGSSDFVAGAFYVSLNGSAEELAMLVRSALRADGHLALLPAGTANVQKMRELTVQAAGKSQRVTLYAISGLDLTPTYVWLDDQQRFFAICDSWYATIRRGWEPAAGQMLQEQTSVDKEYLHALAERLAVKPASDVVFTHVDMFDSESATVKHDQTVVVNGSHISYVGDQPPVVSPAARVINGQGLTLVPGLWDMHVHVGGDSDGLLYVAAGITTTRDMGNNNEELALKRRSFDTGLEIGPRVIPAGFIDGHGPYQKPLGVFADTPEEARKDVAQYAALGYTQIKIYNSVKPELVPVIVQEAHSRGMRVSGHIPAGMIAEEAVKDGYDEIQHMNFIFLNFMPDVKDTNTPARLTEPAKRAADLDISSPAVQSFMQLLLERHVAVDPTLGVIESALCDRPGQTNIGALDYADRMPIQIQRGLKSGGLPVPAGMDERYRRSFEQMKHMLKAMYDHGITIEAGTDSLAGFSLMRELQIYNEAGIPAAKVLQLATLGAARVMSRDKELGSIAPGKFADLMLVDGDPTNDLKRLEHAKLVVKDGVLYDPARIYEALGIKPH